jgi:phenylalanyl-tRNA synthetase alpha chain
MEEELIGIKNTALSFILEAESLESLEETKLQFLGKSGRLTLTIKEIGKIPQENRAAVGLLANEVKETIEDAIKSKEQEIKGRKISKTLEKVDVTDPGIKPGIGHLHLVSYAIEEITAIFRNIGFNRVRYPEVEWDWYSFTALNFPPNHPARDEWETFFIEEKEHDKYGPMLLTPHTSSGQIREMLENKPPIKMLNIAKTYRRQIDVGHTPMFHQFETLAVAEDLSITHLKGTLDYFVRSYFGSNIKTRIRPYHFEFTEPSFEVDITCTVCLGKGCKLCKEGWLEMGGAGMVHPNVLRNAGIDPDKYKGFASGWGVERVLMMRENLNIDDLRLIYSNKLEFLEQF